MEVGAMSGACGKVPVLVPGPVGPIAKLNPTLSNSN